MFEMIDAPWAGRPVRTRWRKRRCICLEDDCEVTTCSGCLSLPAVSTRHPTLNSEEPV